MATDTKPTEQAPEDPSRLDPAPPPPKAGQPSTVNPAALVTMGDKGIMLRSLEDLIRFARLAVSSGAAPKGMTEGAAALAIQAGLERGLGVLGGLQQCVVINGVLSWRGQGAAALIQSSPACKQGTLKHWHEGEGDTLKGIAVAWRVGYPEASRIEFTVKDARTAGLWGKEGPWRTYPGRQLMWRALGFLARDVFPDVLGGFPLSEEAQDFDPVRVTEGPTSPAERRDMLPPPAPDPLFSVLQGQTQKAAEAIPVEATRVEVVTPAESAEPTPEEQETIRKREMQEADEHRGTRPSKRSGASLFPAE